MMGGLNSGCFPVIYNDLVAVGDWNMGPADFVEDELRTDHDQFRHVNPPLRCDHSLLCTYYLWRRT